MNIFITLDYELFLGDVTGTPENCLIRPMDTLCNSLDKYNIKFIIFVDAVYLLRMFQLKEEHQQVKNDYELVVNHLKQLNAQGHDIQLHFHPQWLYSSWDKKEGRWFLDFDHYKLSDMDKNFAFKSFAEAKDLLDTTIGKKTYAFRAGGYSLETFSNYIELFKKNDIYIDSSVCRLANQKSKYQEYDYRNIPDKIIYKFNDSIKNEHQEGKFLELSISSCKWNPIYYFLVLRPYMMKYRPKIIFKDGVSIVLKENNKYFKKVKKLFQAKIFQDSIDGPMSNMLNIVYQNTIDQKQDNLVFIGHPKNFSDQSIHNLELFIKNTINKVNYATTKNLL